MTTSRLAALLVLLLSAVACQRDPAAPSVAAQDSINSVVNMVPAPGTALHPGDTVTFSGTTGYTLATAESGAMFMAIQDQSNRPLTTDARTVVVARGTADVTLSETVTIPAEGVT